MKKLFADFNMVGFWKNSDYAREYYIGETLTNELVISIEQELGYKLPESYIEFMKYQNGGIPNYTKHKTQETTSWADDHIVISGLFGINRTKTYSLGLMSQFMIDEWEYPAIGIYFADCPSAGHDMLCLDYRNCGENVEPQVVHIDQECDYKITVVAPDFETFIRGLEKEEY